MSPPTLTRGPLPRPRRRARRRRRRPASGRRRRAGARSTPARSPSWRRRISRASVCHRWRRPPTARPPWSATWLLRRDAGRRGAARAGRRRRRAGRRPGADRQRRRAARPPGRRRARAGRLSPGSAPPPRCTRCSWGRRRELHDRHRPARLGARAGPSAALRPRPSAGRHPARGRRLRVARRRARAGDGRRGRGDRARRQPRLRGRQQRRRGGGPPRGDRAQPRLRAARAGLAHLAARAAGSEALLVPRLIEADGALQRSAHPLPGRARGSAGTRAPPCCPPAALPQPQRARPPDGRVGDRRGLVAPTAALRRLGPFDPGRSCSTRTWICACAPGPQGCPPSSPRSRGGGHLGGRTPPAAPSAARRSSCRRGGAVRWSGRGWARRGLVDSTTARRPLPFGLRAAVGRERGPQHGGAARAARRAADGHRRTALAQPDDQRLAKGSR